MMSSVISTTDLTTLISHFSLLVYCSVSGFCRLLAQIEVRNRLRMLGGTGTAIVSAYWRILRLCQAYVLVNDGGRRRFEQL
jgi:hypothetical protein